MVLAVSPLYFSICHLKTYYPLYCIHVHSFVNNGNTNDIIRMCHKNKSLTARNKGIIFTPLIYLWVNGPQELDRLSIMQTNYCSQYRCIFFFCYQLPWLWHSLHEGDELFVEHGDMRAQFLWQIMHIFNNVLANKKWDSINVCVVLIREGGGGSSGTLGGRSGTSIIACAPRDWMCCYAEMGIIVSNIDGGIK